MSARRPPGLVRASVAALVAVVLHALGALVIARSDVVVRLRKTPPVVVTMTVRSPTAAPPRAPEQPPLSLPTPTQSKVPTSTRTSPVPRTTPTPTPTQTPPPTPTQTPPGDVTPPATTTATPAGPSLVQRPLTPDGIAALVAGSTSPSGVLAPSLQTLQGALDVRVDGPRTDSAQAIAHATRNLLDDLATDVVTVGLADDYFREVRTHVQAAWQPARTDLSDNGASVTQVGMMRGLVDDRAAWGEMWQAYLDLAQQYAQGQRPQLPPARVEHLRELMRSRKGNFRVSAITELTLTQGVRGELLMLDVTLPSGHAKIDDSVREAFARALQAMPDPPPARVHRGRPFSSSWRLRATWTMVPPTAFFTGTAFDVTSKGLHVDVPMSIQLQTNVMLLRSDAVRAGAAGGTADDDGAAQNAPR